MARPGKARTLVGLVPLFLGGVRLARGVEQKADIVTATATKWDERSSAAIDDFSGCYTDGCGPELLIDGILNDEADGESRWSCSETLEGTVAECYATLDLGSEQSLTKISIWFYKSDELDRDAKPFLVSTSPDGTTFDEAFDSVNTPGTALGVSEDFSFLTGWTGRYVRITSLIPPDEWLSINEIEVSIDVPVTPAPTPGSRGGLTTAPTVGPVPTATVAPVPAPTAGPTVVGGAVCQNITVSNAGDLSGDYYRADGATNYASTGGIEATISFADQPAVCSDSTATACTVKMWQIRPQDTTLATFLTYDEATHPSAITEVWLRLDACTDQGCTSTPSDVSIVCGDGSTAGGTAAPAAAPTDSTCGVIEVAGTSGGESDGFYYDDGSDPADAVTQYTGYDEVNGELTSNGNLVVARRVETTCTSAGAATSASSETCSWRQWWVEPAAAAALDYYTFDEASHPVDIAPGALWYTSNEEVLPYDGEVTITCAPATTPALPGGATTPSPSGGDDDGDDGTRAPVSPGSTASPAGPSGTDGVTGDDGDGGSNIPVIAGGVAGGVALLAIVGAVAYKLKKPPPPPPSYDDLVGG